MRKKAPVIIVIAILIVIPSIAGAQISGSLTGAMGPGNYQVVGAIDVPPFQSLTLLPGTTFEFTGNYDFDVYGDIQAVGTETDSIIFANAPGADKWNGINVSTLASDDCRFEYCVIKGSDESAIFIYGNSMNMAHCTITENETGDG